MLAGSPPGSAGTAAGDAARKAVHDELTLQLPSAGGGPLASPELVRPEAPGHRSPGLRAPRWLRFRPGAAGCRWRAGGCPCSPSVPAAALAVLGDSGLGGSAGRRTSAAIAGGSLTYLAAVARFAAGLAARGRVLPVLETEGEATRPGGGRCSAAPTRSAPATWPRPCPRPAGPPPGTAPGTLLGSALDALADAAARARLPAPLLPARRGRTPARLPLAERFVLALTTADARLDVVTPQDEAEAAALAAELGAWRDGAVIPAGPVRTCFRLAEPATPEADPWRVEFALQSADDPSLMVSAADVWSGLGAGLAAGGDPVEELLAGLGAAARLFGELDGRAARGGPGPGGDGHAGRVPVPQGDRAAAGRRRVRRAAAGLGAQGQARAEADHAVADRVRLVGRRGGRGQVRPGRPGGLPVRRGGGRPGARPGRAGRAGPAEGPAGPAARPVGRAGRRAPEGGAEVPRAQPGRDDDRGRRADGRARPGTGRTRRADEDVPLVGVDADGWLGDLLSGQADRRLRPMPTPAGFSGELRPYQQRGLSWLSFLGELGPRRHPGRRHGPGQDHPAAVARLGRPGPAAGPTLLVCPMSLVGNWQREAARFTPDLRVHVHHGADRLDGDSLAEALAGADLVITTYGVATRDQAALGQVSWARVVCDEAQNIKNHATKQARAVRALPAAARIALTGTPVENRLSELWSIMEFTNPGLLGPAERFRERYAVPIERHGSPEATAGAQAAHPAVHAPPPEDRQDDHLRPAGQAGDEGLLQPHLRAGQPVPGHGHRHAQPHRGGRRRHQPPRPGAGHHGQAQAGVQPSRPPARRRLPAAGPVRQAGPARGDLRRDRGRGRQGAVLHPVRRVRPDAAAAPGGQARLPGAVPARRHDEETAGRDGRARSASSTSRPCSCCRSRRAAPGST